MKPGTSSYTFVPALPPSDIGNSDRLSPHRHSVKPIPTDEIYDEKKHSDRYSNIHKDDDDDDDVEVGGKPKSILDGDASSRPKPMILSAANRVASFLVKGQELRAALIQGLSVTKYGRNGPPREKILVLLEDTDELQWKDLEGRSRRFSWKNKKDEPSTLAISSILEVRRGVTTPVLIKALPKVDPLSTLSFVTKERTLDVAVSSVQEREALIRTMRKIFEERKLPVKII